MGYLDIPRIGVPPDVPSISPVAGSAWPPPELYRIVVMIAFEVRIPPTSLGKRRRLVIAPVPHPPPLMLFVTVRADTVPAISAVC